MLPSRRQWWNASLDLALAETALQDLQQPAGPVSSRTSEPSNRNLVRSRFIDLAHEPFGGRNGWLD